MQELPGKAEADPAAVCVAACLDSVAAVDR
jgi:hypothetical protein